MKLSIFLLLLIILSTQSFKFSRLYKYLFKRNKKLPSEAAEPNILHTHKTRSFGLEDILDDLDQTRTSGTFSFLFGKKQSSNAKSNNKHDLKLQRSSSDISRSSSVNSELYRHSSSRRGSSPFEIVEDGSSSKSDTIPVRKDDVFNKLHVGSTILTLTPDDQRKRTYFDNLLCAYNKRLDFEFMRVLSDVDDEYYQFMNSERIITDLTKISYETIDSKCLLFCNAISLLRLSTTISDKEIAAKAIDILDISSYRKLYGQVSDKNELYLKEYLLLFIMPNLNTKEIQTLAKSVDPNFIDLSGYASMTKGTRMNILNTHPQIFIKVIPGFAPNTPEDMAILIVQIKIEYVRALLFTYKSMPNNVIVILSGLSISRILKERYFPEAPSQLKNSHYKDLIEAIRLVRLYPSIKSDELIKLTGLPELDIHLVIAAYGLINENINYYHLHLEFLSCRFPQESILYPNKFAIFNRISLDTAISYQTFDPSLIELTIIRSKFKFTFRSLPKSVTIKSSQFYSLVNIGLINKDSNFQLRLLDIKSYIDNKTRDILKIVNIEESIIATDTLSHIVRIYDSDYYRRSINLLRLLNSREYN